MSHITKEDYIEKMIILNEYTLLLFSKNNYNKAFNITSYAKNIGNKYSNDVTNDDYYEQALFMKEKLSYEKGNDNLAKEYFIKLKDLNEDNSMYTDWIDFNRIKTIRNKLFKLFLPIFFIIMIVNLFPIQVFNN
jgi:hypothetical protein